MITTLATIGAVTGVAGFLFGSAAYFRSRRRPARKRSDRVVPSGSGLVDERAVRDIGMVRYDALEQMSGARSFSLALLNASGDGIVLTSINGRSETRTYAKLVEEGNAREELSPEEYRAVRAARMGQGPGSEARRSAEAGSSRTAVTEV
ncbi:DUF4446 family protein [Spiractinospora alimapuensis]|uniref:DUF4446 family protein n=1 Tax=Spiractinospora alimapuensis TaxID=2820884 RepID=UPI001F46407E|nr:DUF4446 family protein [Spiractinospora alimapuensis]QVQ50445.1 DUF4446 family protein [Spiractinospora alimapuensis]